MKTEEINKYLAILDHYKSYFGFADYKVTISKSIKVHNEYFAEIESNYYDKTLDVRLYNKFRKLSDAGKKNTLVHELIHARLGVMQEKQQKLIDELEEEFVNDLTRGVIVAEEEIENSIYPEYNKIAKITTEDPNGTKHKTSSN